MTNQVLVVPHNTEWSHLFELEAGQLTLAFGPEVIIVHHIGSTAIPDIRARPIIDILVEVRDIEKIDALNAWMERVGYRPVGEHGIPGRRFFIKTENGLRTRNVYVFPAGHVEIQRCLDFRDYLITHANEAIFYSLLKDDLAKKYPEDILEYMRGKHPFIQEVLRRAETWRMQAPAQE